MILSRRRYMGERYDLDTQDYGYLALKALRNTSFTFVMPSQVSTTNVSGISYSLDLGETWVTVNNVNDELIEVQTPIIAKGDYVLWKGNNKRVYGNNLVFAYFTSDDVFSISGNLMSLLWGDDYALHKQTKDWFCFNGLFFDSKIVSAKSLKIDDWICHPGTFWRTFGNCTFLKEAPERISFSGQNGDRGQCLEMFLNCINLKESPIFNIEILPSNCFRYCFNNCSKLNKITLHTTNISSSNALFSWVSGVASTGVFYKLAGVDIPVGSSGIPSGWNVIEENI